MEKEQLRKEFREFCKQFRTQNHEPENMVFTWFYSKLEEKDKANHKHMQDALLVCQTLRFNDIERLRIEISRLTSLLSVAEEVIKFSRPAWKYSENIEYHKALEKYTTLKKEKGK